MNYTEIRLNYYKKLPNRFWIYNIAQLKNRYKYLLEEVFLKFGVIDIIHAQAMYPAGYIAMQLSAMFCVPYVVQEHMSYNFMNSLPIMSKGKFNLIAQKILNNASACIAVSTALAKQLQMICYSKVAVIPNFIEDKTKISFSDKLRHHQPFRFLSVANLVPGKRIDILIKALAILYHQYNIYDWKLTICGAGSSLIELESLSITLGLNHNIDFVGSVPRDDIAGYFANCDAFVLPSAYETFGVVYIEALAFGKPVIATRCGGPEDIVNDLNGFLIDVDDIEGLASALQNMILCYDHFSSKLIYDDYVNQFSAIVSCRKLLAIYEVAIAKNK